MKTTTTTKTVKIDKKDLANIIGGRNKVYNLEGCGLYLVC